MSSLGFFLLRHVTNEETGRYWKLAYNRIRKFHPDSPVVVVDDASDYRYIRAEDEEGIRVIRSEFPGRAELLPYLIYLHHPIAERACILHDSVFLNAPLKTTVYSHQILWSFEHWYDNEEKETEILRDLKNSDELIQFYHRKDIWKGCFGGMSIISHDYLSYLQDRYNIQRLASHIYSRDTRYHFERVIGCILQLDHRRDALFGSIHSYCPWGITFDDMGKYEHLPAIKVWSRR